MSMPVSEKNFLERVASHIPGIAGYREREARRETDRRLREYLATRLESGRESLQAVRRAVVDAGALGLMNPVGEIDRILQKSVSSLRYADYGYSGLFDQVKIREEELDRIYAYDASLVAEVQDVVSRLVAAAHERPEAAALSDLESRVEELDRKIVERRNLFETPSV